MFNKPNIQKKEIIESINAITNEYKAEHSNCNIVIKICKKSIKVIKKLSSSDLYYEICSKNVPIELAALNVMQNCTMLYIKPVKSANAMLLETDIAADYFNYLNDEKFDKGYITEEQYEKNKLVSTKLRMKNLFPF